MYHYSIERPGNPDCFTLHFEQELPKIPYTDDESPGTILKKELLGVPGVDKDVHNSRYSLTIYFGKMFEVKDVADNVVRHLIERGIIDANTKPSDPLFIR